MKKLLIICGPTATGKTNLGLALAKKFKGQIISADSRQVYQGLDIGTGKDLPKGIKKHTDGHYLINNIKVWGYDLVKPDQDFSVAHFVKFTTSRLKAIWQVGELPIIVGGTGLYLKAITKPLETITVPANQKLRQKLNKLSVSKLQTKLKKLDPNKFKSMNHSDQLNPRRLIRAIEIQKGQSQKDSPSGTVLFETDQLWIGLKTDKKILDTQIEKRVNKRLKAGAQQEVKHLIKQGYSFDLPSMSAMGYKQWQLFFEKKHNLDQVRQFWITAEKQYLRRQLTWFNSQSNINWFDINDSNFQKKVARTLSDWYTNH